MITLALPSVLHKISICKSDKTLAYKPYQLENTSLEYIRWTTKTVKLWVHGKIKMKQSTFNAMKYVSVHAHHHKDEKPKNKVKKKQTFLSNYHIRINLHSVKNQLCL